MSQQLAQRSQPSFVLKVLNGPDKGAVYRLVSNKVTIGREEENDISLKNDRKCSRQHAVIAMTSNGVEIKNVSSRNIVEVDGRKIDQTVLSPNSVIQIGDTKLQFNLSSENSLASPSKGMSSNRGINRKQRRRQKPGGGPSPTFYIIVAGLGLLVWYLLTSEVKQKEIPTIPSEEEVSAQIEKSKQVAEQLRLERRQSGRDTREYREAQAAYIKGFRDSQKGQYERARGHFQTCLAIFPDHPLCGQALQDASNKFNELVQYYFNLGNGYLSRNQFRQCKNAFRNVMIMQRDRTSRIFREAEAQFQTCDLKERERL